ncbi:MAG: hypothetical protein AB1752_14585 [Candidatus Zixiibacteriota bacterium]
MQDAKRPFRFPASGAKIGIMLAIISGGVGLSIGDPDLVSASLVFSAVTLVVTWGALLISLKQARDDEQRAGIEALERINVELKTIIDRIEHDTETRRLDARPEDDQA